MILFLFFSLSSGFPVTQLRLETAELAVCLFPIVRPNLKELVSALFHGAVSRAVCVGRDQCFSDFQRERQAYKVEAYVPTQQGKQKWGIRVKSKINLSLVQEQTTRGSMCLRVKLFFVSKEWINDWNLCSYWESRACSKGSGECWTLQWLSSGRGFSSLWVYMLNS